MAPTATCSPSPQDTAANARESVRLTRARLDGGVAPRTDLRQAEQILATAEDAIAAADEPRWRRTKI